MKQEGINWYNDLQMTNIWISIMSPQQTDMKNRVIETL